MALMLVQSTYQHGARITALIKASAFSRGQQIFGTYRMG